jgi:hypothetical protein
MAMLVSTALAAMMVFQSADEWQIGVEREVDAGVYMTLMERRDGWTLYRVEDVQGFACVAVKPANGSPEPRPLGFGDSFYQRNGMRLELWTNISERPTRRNPRVNVYMNWEAREITTEVMWRRPGDRFFNAVDSLPGSRQMPDQIEIHRIAYEYPELGIGRYEQTETFELAGIAWAEDQVRACHRPGPPAS